MFPESILKEIVERAEESWPGDPEMQKSCISEEREAYKSLDNLDFREYGELKRVFIKSAKETFESWDEILASVQSELSAYSDLQRLSVDGVDLSTLDAWKREAAEEYEGYYEGQLEFVKGKIAKHLSILETRKG